MSIEWSESRTAQRVRTLLKNGFSYRYIENRCMIPRWRIVAIVKREKCGVRGYRNGETDRAKEILREIDAMFRQINKIGRMANAGTR